ncbi:MAG: response regulator, partial [Acidimicrobiia bacterium]|nr:response regulator [Acidimicrobiia bacterium]
LNDLLDHAKIESGKLQIEHIPFRLRDVVNDTIKTLEVSAAASDLTLEAEVEPELPELVRGDPTRLRQVLINLIGNAIKFTEEGGVYVTIRAPEPHEMDLATIEVRDTGIGIPEDRLESIFEAFEQADSATTRNFGGTGLGLTITSHLIHLMGGRIWVESQFGSGSTFFFTVPLPQANVEVVRPAMSPVGAEVLVLTDSPLNRESIIDVLTSGDMQPRVVDTVEQALRQLTRAAVRHEPYSLVVCDIQKDGIGVASRLVEVAPESPIVLLTASGQRGDAARCRELGIPAYLTGTPTSQDLLETFAEVLTGPPTLITRHWLRERRRSLRILVADDSPTNRLLAIRLLEKQGHTVIGVENGADAVTALEREPYDIVLMDIHMPVLDGYSATGQIRAMPTRRSETPIVALTGSVNEEGRQKCLDSGMDRFVAKPFKVDELLDVIAELTA